MKSYWQPRRCVRRFSLLLLIGTALVSATLVVAQFKPAEPRPIEPTPDAPNFTIKVNLVRLLVSVRDSAGRLITTLNRQDFRVTDSGEPQEIAVFERNTSLPLSVAILIDTSGSTEKDLHSEVESVQRFLPALLNSGNPEDAFELFSFNWRTSLELDFSRSERRAERALHGLHGEGGTSLYDAIYLGSDTLLQRSGRHVMVIVTDGGDTTSYKHYNDALAAAQRADVVLYPIVVVPITADAGRNTGGEHALATLAESTGGRIFYPASYEKLDVAFADILKELRTQYLIGFYPQAPHDPVHRFHPVKVSTQNPGLKMAARSGYYEP
jgi:Ca-activated chloride channel family protein